MTRISATRIWASPLRSLLPEHAIGVYQNNPGQSVPAALTDVRLDLVKFNRGGVFGFTPGGATVTVQQAGFYAVVGAVDMLSENPISSTFRYAEFQVNGVGYALGYGFPLPGILAPNPLTGVQILELPAGALVKMRANHDAAVNLTMAVGWGITSLALYQLAGS